MIFFVFPDRLFFDLFNLFVNLVPFFPNFQFLGSFFRLVVTMSSSEEELEVSVSVSVVSPSSSWSVVVSVSVPEVLDEDPSVSVSVPSSDEELALFFFFFASLAAIDLLFVNVFFPYWVFIIDLMMLARVMFRAFLIFVFSEAIFRNAASVKS